MTPTAHLILALNSPHQLSPLFRREFPYLPDQPLYSAFLLSRLHGFANLSPQPQQSRSSNPKLSPYLFNVQMGIGAGGDTNVTVAQQITGGLPVVSTSAASITLQLVIDRRRS
ncbi:hypothetical protein TUM17386_02050 [Shewanella algae]|nr:hypothetical protein TUM17386_02050 [Shewanella algae]